MPHFVLFVPPVAPIDGTAHYYWVLLKWLHEFEGSQTSVFLPAYYLDVGADASRWELSEWSVRFHEYKVREPKSTSTRFFHYEDLLARSLCGEAPLERFVSYVTQDLPELYEYFLGAFSLLKEQHSEVVAVTWLNCPSMRRAAEVAGCPLVFNEIGPLRKPYYSQCAYWDKSGVNGDTEVDARWSAEKHTFREWLGTGDEAAINEMLESVLISSLARDMFNTSTVAHAVGVALQVETDSNVLAFSKGWSNLSLLEFAGRACPDQQPFIRYHPNGKALYADGIVDLGRSPLRFLGSIQELWTINSSLGIEAVLWRKKVRFFGGTPISTYFEEADDASGAFRVWFFLNYLIPYSLLFSADYYIWRLSGPSVADVAEKHLHVYRVQGHEGQYIDNSLPSDAYHRIMSVGTPNSILNELFDLRQRCSDQDSYIADMQAQIGRMHALISDMTLLRRDAEIAGRTRELCARKILRDQIRTDVREQGDVRSDGLGNP